jgi:hypothetical protein
MQPSKTAVLIALAVLISGVVGGLAGGAVVATRFDDRVATLESDATAIRAEVEQVENRARTRIEAIGDGVVRIVLTDALEPESIFGGIQAFVETGTTAHGCIASVSETNVGQYGPFYVLCTPRAPVIDGRRREGILLQIRPAAAGGRSDKLFPPGSIVEITLWQPGALHYATPVPCVIGAPNQC